MQSQRNFRYTKPFQNLGWESDLFNEGEPDEKSRLRGFCNKNPEFSVTFPVFSPHFSFKNFSSEICARDFKRLSACWRAEFLN